LTPEIVSMNFPDVIVGESAEEESDEADEGGCCC
jgi:hypothetical protein